MLDKIYSVKNVLGGSNFYNENGQLVGCSVSGTCGGEDSYGVNGKMGYFVDSVFCSRELYEPEGQRSFTLSSVLEGKDIQGDVNGYSLDSPFGDESIFIDEG